MLKDVWKHQFYFLLILVVLTIRKWWVGRWGGGLEVLWWWLGALSGYLFVYLDAWLYELVNNFKKAFSWKLREVLALWVVVEEKEQLIMRNALFVVVWMFLAILTVTSVASTYSRGLVLGIGLHLMVDMYTDYRRKGWEIDWWFRQIKRRISLEEKKIFVGVMALLYLLVIVNL